MENETQNPNAILLRGHLAEFYHKDINLPGDVQYPCLSASLLKTLMEHSPSAVRHELDNPPDTPTEAMMSGSAAHAYILSDDPNKSLCPIDAPDWRTKDAREQRDAALVAGRVPILVKTENKKSLDLDRLNQMRDKYLASPLNTKLAHLQYTVEASVYWLNGGVWKRARHDLLPAPEHLRSGIGIIDYKTTGKGFRRWGETYLTEAHGFIRLVHYVESVIELFGICPNVWFVVQENEPPYSVQYAVFNIGSWLGWHAKAHGVELPFETPPHQKMPDNMIPFVERNIAAFHMVDEMVEWAVDDWRGALETGEWPEPPAATQLRVPDNVNDRLASRYPAIAQRYYTALAKARAEHEHEAQQQ